MSSNHDGSPSLSVPHCWLEIFWFKSCVYFENVSVSYCWSTRFPPPMLRGTIETRNKGRKAVISIQQKYSHSEIIQKHNIKHEWRKKTSYYIPTNIHKIKLFKNAWLQARNKIRKRLSLYEKYIHTVKLSKIQRLIALNKL